MFSFQKIDHLNYQDGRLRGSPLLSYIQQHATKHGHMKIRSVHSCSGHLAVMIDDQRTCILLDYVPESLLSSQSNETISLNLLSNTLLSLNDVRQKIIKQSGAKQQQSQSSSSSSLSSSPPSIIDLKDTKSLSAVSAQMKSAELTQSLKKNLNRFLFNNNKSSSSNQSSASTSGNSIVSQDDALATKESIDPGTEPLSIFSEGASSNSVLCFGDIFNPLVSVFFQTVRSGNDIDTRLFALQSNGLLWCWRFDEVRYVWNSCGSSQIIPDGSLPSRILHSTFVSSQNKLVWAQFSGDEVPSVDIMTTSINLSGKPSLLEVKPAVLVRSITSTPRNEFIRNDISSSVLELRETKHGFWMFTPEGIEHVSLDESKSFPSCNVSGTHIRHFIQHLSNLESLKQEKEKTTTSGSAEQQITTTEQSVPTIDSSDLFYVTHHVHPISKELVILRMNGEIQICTPSTTAQTTLSVRSLKQPISQFSIDEKMTLYKKVLAHYEQARKSPASTSSTLLTLKKQAAQCKQGTFIELFFIHNTILAVTDQELCMVYEPRTCTRLAQVQLPNEIALDEKYHSHAGARSVVWNVYGQSARSGLFSSSGLYFIKCPPIADLLKLAAETSSSSSSVSSASSIKNRDLYHIAMRAKQWGLNGWYVKYILDLAIRDADQAQKQKHQNTSKDDSKKDSSSNAPKKSTEFDTSTVTKKKILDDLCTRLENPSLVWTATKSLYEQKHILKRVSDFLLHFPSPDSSFWKTEKQMQLSNNLKRKFQELSQTSSLATPTTDQEASYWDSLLETVAERSKSQVSPQDTFDMMTQLNLSLVPTLAKSLSLSKEQIDSFMEPVASYSDVTSETVSTETQQTSNDSPRLNASSIEQLSDIELDDLAKERPLDVLRGLCEICGLNSFRDYIDAQSEEKPSHDSLFYDSKRNAILGYQISMNDKLNPILLVNFEQSNDELLSLFDTGCMSRPLTPYEAVSSNFSFIEEASESSLVGMGAGTEENNGVCFSPFTVGQGSFYFELLCRLVFESTQHPALISVLVAMVHHTHMTRMKDELEREENQLNQLMSKTLPSVVQYSEQVRKHLVQQQKQKVKHLQRLISQREDSRAFLARRALEVVLSVYHSSDMELYESIFTLKLSNTSVSDFTTSSSSNYSRKQVEALVQLLLWSGQTMAAIQLLLSQKMESRVLEVLNTYIFMRDVDSSSSRLDYQNIKLTHEEQCELVHILTRYCCREDQSKRGPLWSVIWDLIPVSYSPFHFLEEFGDPHDNIQQQQQEEAETNRKQQQQKPSIFASPDQKSQTISMEDLITNLQNKFVRSGSSSVNKLF